jgi:hypothetical protein
MVVPRFRFSLIQTIVNLVHLAQNALAVRELVVDLVLVDSLYLPRRSMKHYIGSVSFKRQRLSRSDIPREQGLREPSPMQLTLLGRVAVATVG